MPYAHCGGPTTRAQPLIPAAQARAARSTSQLWSHNCVARMRVLTAPVVASL